MASKPIVPITTGKEDYAERLASVIGSAFARDALNRAVVLTKDSLPNDSEISDERRAEHFLPHIRNQAKNGAVLVESGNWAAVALWHVLRTPLKRALLTGRQGSARSSCSFTRPKRSTATDGGIYRQILRHQEKVFGRTPALVLGSHRKRPEENRVG